MGLFDKVVGHAEVGGDVSIVNEYLFENEEIIQTFTFLRDSIVLTNLGIYVIDVQGLSGKKVEVKFFPKKTIKTISFESAGTFDGTLSPCRILSYVLLTAHLNPTSHTRSA